MIEHLDRAVKNFVDTYIDKERGLLVAVSGGIDSLALLLALSKIPNLILAVAHVDHGWRETSKREADDLRQVTADLGYPFHLKTLTPSLLKGNLENASREARYEFFTTLIKKFNYQGIVLGHHADDQTETVLKRVFEGAHLTKCCGIEPIKRWKETVLFRPLLAISKDLLTEYIRKTPYTPVHDRTNEDPKFLRARMRTEIIPTLLSQFGKNIKPGLLALSQEAYELTNYLDSNIHPYLQKIIQGPFGLFLDLSTERPLHTFEMRYLIKKIGELMNMALSKQMIVTLSHLIYSGVAHRKIAMREKEIHVDRGCLFIFYNQQEAHAKQPLTLGVSYWGAWKVTVEKIEKNSSPKSNRQGCMNIWKGSVSFSLPVGKYFFAPYNPNIQYRKKASLSKWLSNHKIPMCLRRVAPIVVQGNEVFYEIWTKNEFKDVSEGLFVNLQPIQETV